MIRSILDFSEAVNPRLRARLIGASHHFPIPDEPLTWTCGGSRRSAGKNENRKPCSYQIVGIGPGGYHVSKG